LFAVDCCCLLWIAVVCRGLLLSAVDCCCLLWIVVVCYGLLLSAVDCCCLLRIAVVCRGLLLSAMNCCCLPWIAVVCYGLLLSAVDCCCLLRAPASLSDWTEVGKVLWILLDCPRKDDISIIKTIFSHLKAVLRNRDVYPGSRIFIFSIPDPGSRVKKDFGIPDLDLHQRI
jgi:hypothetical protein